MPHTVVHVSTGRRLIEVDYVSENSFTLAKAALDLYRTFYKNQYRLTVAIVAENGELVPLPEQPFPVPPKRRFARVLDVLSLFPLF
jgi:hypothetical protein